MARTIHNEQVGLESMGHQAHDGGTYDGDKYDHNVFVQAALDIKQDMHTHAHDISEHNRTMLERRASRAGKIGQHVLNISRAAAYTSYFWLDDYLMRPITKLTGSTATTVLAVGSVSTLLGGTLAFFRRRQLNTMYTNQGAEISDEGPRIIHSTTAAILGAPQTVKEMAIRSIDDSQVADPSELGMDNETDVEQDEQAVGGRRVRIMTVGAVGTAAAVYGYLQGFTAGPVIDAIDSHLPGKGFVRGDIPATTAFVAPAIYLKTASSVWYNRRKERKNTKQKATPEES